MVGYGVADRGFGVYVSVVWGGTLGSWDLRRSSHRRDSLCCFRVCALDQVSCFFVDKKHEFAVFLLFMDSEAGASSFSMVGEGRFESCRIVCQQGFSTRVAHRNWAKVLSVTLGLHIAQSPICML